VEIRVKDLQKDFWLTIVRQVPETSQDQLSPEITESGMGTPWQIDPDDPIIGYFQEFPEAVEIEELNLNSTALDQLSEFGVKLVVPLINQGELVGLLNLVEQSGEENYIRNDRRLLGNLANQAEAMLKIAQLVRSRQLEISEREDLEHDRRIANVIQETLIPREVPFLPGWQAKTYWQPAKEVSGDFYDFFNLANGRLGLVIGDVTDKGLPTTLVMATTRSILRDEMIRKASPGQVLSKVNNLLCSDIPHNMFVTCLCAILDPNTGNLSYANAGHNLPICQRMQGIEELRATGMPLGLFPEMVYEEGATTLEPGDKLLLFSDGLVEAHNKDREMFGFGRLRGLVEDCIGCEGLEDILLSKFDEFTGEMWEQEDDVIIVSLQREQLSRASDGASSIQSSQEGSWIVLGEFSLPSEVGVERLASEKVIQVMKNLPLNKAQIDRLTTAVAEATMNAIEHGNQFDPKKPVIIKVTASDSAVSVHITDQGGSLIVPGSKEPDLEAKLAGLESPRGWGLFIIRKMVDHFEIISSEFHHTIILTMFLGGEADAR